MQVKKHQLEQDMEQQTGSKLAKEYVKAVYCHPVYLTYMQSTSCEMPGWMRHKLESRLPGEMSITSDMQMTPPLWQKVKVCEGAQSCPTLSDPMDSSLHQAPPSVGFSRQESGTTEQLHTLSLSAIRVVSSAYLRLLIFLLAILIPAFLMMYSAYKLNKQDDNIQR